MRPVHSPRTIRQAARCSSYFAALSFILTVTALASMLVAKGSSPKGLTTSSLSRKGMILASDPTVMELLMSSPLVPQTVAVSDQIYSMIPPETLEMFLHHDRTDEGTYRREIHDCDDFALELMMSGRKPLRPSERRWPWGLS